MSTPHHHELVALILGNVPKLSLTVFLYAKSLEQGKRTLLCGLTGGNPASCGSNIHVPCACLGQGGELCLFLTVCVSLKRGSRRSEMETGRQED